MTQIFDDLNKVFNFFYCSNKLVITNKNLFNLSDTEISTPVGDVLPLLIQHKSKLPNQLIHFELLEKLIERLSSGQSIVRLNHIGFCYKVDSQEKEKERLIRLIKQTKFHLYQEKSIDDGLWLFIGNTNKWEEPLIELIPVEKGSGKWVDNWLPHIQIDVDTILTAREIEKRISPVFTNTRRPHLITIDGIVYIVRNHLGIIDGVNIFLDLATNSRDVKFHRQQLLTKIG